MRKLITILFTSLAAILLLSSCTINTPIDTYLKATTVTEYQYTKSISPCPLTQWEVERQIGSSLVKTTILTECKQAYFVEFINEEQYLNAFIYEYNLPDYKQSIYVWQEKWSEKVIQGDKLIPLKEFLGGLKR
jgi:hypothetical protein